MSIPTHLHTPNSKVIVGLPLWLSKFPALLMETILISSGIPPEKVLRWTFLPFEIDWL